MTLDLHATPEEVMRAVGALEEFCREHHVEDKMVFGLTLALEECASNIVNHALRRDPQWTFSVAIEHTGAALVIELRDRGPAFDPTQAPVIGDNAADDDRPPGGWGIQLVRRYTDQQTYTRDSDENVLRLVKNFP